MTIEKLKYNIIQHIKHSIETGSEMILTVEDAMEIIKALEQETKIGHWIEYGKLYQCSECKELSCCQGKFCNECGARMIEP